MSIAEKLVTIAENQQRVYDAGYAKGQEAGGDTESAYNEGYEAGQTAENTNLWNMITANGTRTYYVNAFAYTGAEEIKPPMQIVPDAIPFMFQYSAIKKVSAKHFDLSKATFKSSTYNNRVNASVFIGCADLEDLSEIEFPVGGYYYTFYNCRKLHSIGAINVAEDDMFSAVFNYCYALKNLTVKGTIGQEFNVAYCNALTHDSAMSIINALKDLGNTGTKIVYFSSATKALLSDAEKAIATEKGWTLG